MMQEFLDVLSHPASKAVLLALLGYFIFSAAMDALPEPAEVQNRFGRWACRFGHILAGNLKRAAKALKVPGGTE